MSIRESLLEIERRWSWGLFGFSLAIVATGIGIYREFYRDLRADLIFEVVSEVSVLDVREEVSELRVLYGDQDITESNQTLTILTIFCFWWRGVCSIRGSRRKP